MASCAFAYLRNPTDIQMSLVPLLKTNIIKNKEKAQQRVLALHGCHLAVTLTGCAKPPHTGRGKQNIMPR